MWYPSYCTWHKGDERSIISLWKKMLQRKKVTSVTFQKLCLSLDVVPGFNMEEKYQPWSILLFAVSSTWDRNHFACQFIPHTFILNSSRNPKVSSDAKICEDDCWRKCAIFPFAAMMLQQKKTWCFGVNWNYHMWANRARGVIHWADQCSILRSTLISNQTNIQLAQDGLQKKVKWAKESCRTQEGHVKMPPTTT